MGEAEQLDFFEESDPKKTMEADKELVRPDSDRAGFLFTLAHQATGDNEKPPRDGLELEQTSEQRRENEKRTARQNFAGKK